MNITEMIIEILVEALFSLGYLDTPERAGLKRLLNIFTSPFFSFSNLTLRQQ